MLYHSFSKRRPGGFTLVEIMIVVAIIALLAAIAVPNFMRARKRSQATQILEEIRMVDAALDQYAVEHSRTGGTPADWADLKNYIKTGTSLYSAPDVGITGAYGPFTVDSVPKVNPLILTEYLDVTDDTFWSPYR